MQSVAEIAEAILDREGGYVNDGDVDSADVRRLSKAQAKAIFIENYFHDPKIAALPAVLHATVFDMQVNAGNNAVKILQRLLRKMGLDVSVDGRIGPQTVEAARHAVELAPDHLADAYGIERRNYYYALADRRAASRKYARARAERAAGSSGRRNSFPRNTICRLPIIPPGRGPGNDRRSFRCDFWRRA